MSRNGHIEFDWADGHYRFRLAIGELEELQEKVDAGPLALLQRLESGSWKVRDIRETIRLGLIGGGRDGSGMDAERAETLVRRYVDERPWLDNVVYARAILSAAIIGVPEEVVGKSDGAEATKKSRTRKAGSPSRRSTKSEPSSTSM